MNTHTFESDDGTRIHVYAWPLDEPKAVIQIAHGAAEHAARYARVAEALNAAGYAVYADDHRGHGKSAIPGKLGVFADSDGWNRAVADLVRLNGLISEKHPGAPIVLLGHSMGSLMAQQYMSEYGDSVAAIALSGSTMVEGFAEALPLLEAEREQDGRDAPCKLMAEMMGGGFNAGIDAPQTTHDWLSRDAEEVRKYLDDPLCGFELSIGAWLDMLSANRVPGSVEALASVPKQLPIYVFSGDKDPVSNNTEALEALLALYAAAGLTAVSHRFYPGARHELLNETNRDEVTEDLISWLASVV